MGEADQQFEELIGHLHETRGFDFTGYKRSSLMRRVQRRMSQVRIAGYGEYLEFLQARPDEFTALFNTILINVTSFFRDPEAWDHLRREVLEPMLAAKPADAPLRVWTAGCASGEEAYTVAMLLSEILGPEDLHRRVKIYATDVDDEQLAEARHAVYDERALAGVPPELAERYFEPTGRRFRVRRDLRRSVIFGRNDLVQNAPIPRIDLLTCRNTMMYFTADTQARVLARFHFALAPHGALFLGRAETLRGHAGTFQPIDNRHRMFRKSTGPLPPYPAPPAPGAAAASGPARAALAELADAALRAGPVAQVVITADGLVALSNKRAESLLGVSPRDTGRPFGDLGLAHRPVELGAPIAQARRERRTVHVPDVELRRAAGGSVFLDVHVAPLLTDDGGILGVTLVFQDVSAARRLREELELAHVTLETAYEELRAGHEELETTNEELQATIEELETTNEELQTVNEELELANQDLRSSNDELQAGNARLRVGAGERDASSAFLASVLAHLRQAVVVVDPGLRVRAWNNQATDLWGLRPDEVTGQRLPELDCGLPVHLLEPLISRALTGDHGDGPAVLEAIDRHGRTVALRTVCTPLPPGSLPGGAIIVMESS
ncbi:CheR family methyltransferase [Symbioplanes lichenis]|uniref:CheR family methyltransferase n=1 Tax=Symbioplanes lichenis TaxID=1629072 RepID=UPI00273A58A3|nr:CheR family methyltransferase [Actinoplanes lichenis]